jgi:hypothetical protein
MVGSMNIMDPSDEVREMYLRELELLRAAMGIVGRSRRPMYLVRKFLLRVRYSRLVAYW